MDNIAYLDFCFLCGTLDRKPIPEACGTCFYTKIGEELSLSQMIFDSETLEYTTLGEFCDSCVTMPFKIIVVRDYGWARVRDDKEWVIDRDTKGSICIS